MLDPGFKGRNVSDDNIASAFDWTTKHTAHLGLDFGTVLSDVAEYRTSPGIWPRNVVWDSAKHITLAAWWQSLLYNTAPGTSCFCSKRKMWVWKYTKSSNKLTQTVEAWFSLGIFISPL